MTTQICNAKFGRLGTVLLILSMLMLPHGTAFAQCSSSIKTPSALHVEERSLILFEGDSLTYGYDPGPTGGRNGINGTTLKRSINPFPERIGYLLGGKVRIQNHGFPGDRSKDGWERWNKSASGSVVVIMYGTNDMGNYGHNPEGSLSTELFESYLQKIILKHLANKSQIILLVPPPIRDRHVDERLEGYRCVVKSVGNSFNVRTIDAGNLLYSLSNKWTDGLHLSTEANERIAEYISSLIVVKSDR